MILTFGDKETAKVWNAKISRSYPLEIQHKARRKLRMLNASHDLNDLSVPPSNKLEKLKGNLSSYYSIRINIRWRIIFQWEEGNAYEVRIIDYH